MTLSTAVALKASIVQSMLGSTALPSPAGVSDVDAAEALIFASETPPTYLQARGGGSLRSSVLSKICIKPTYACQSVLATFMCNR